MPLSAIFQLPVYCCSKTISTCTTKIRSQGSPVYLNIYLTTLELSTGVFFKITTSFSRPQNL